MASIADRLVNARQKEFVGREAEQELFRAALRERELPFSLLHLYGPGGVGKSALLRVFAGLCAAEGVPCHLLDARNIEPSAEGFLAGMRSLLSSSAREKTADPLSLLAEPDRRVLLLDTGEYLDGLTSWLRDVFLPLLSSEILVVMAGRTPFSAEWLTTPGWQSIVHVASLQNLSSSESKDFLRQRSVPEVLHRQALDFTHGHPLALALTADVLRRDSVSLPETSPDVVQSLLQRFMEKIPSVPQRAALEAFALLRVTDEAILREMLQPDVWISEEVDAAGQREQARALFDWLRGLSFAELAPGGLFPHDIVREALLADLRWRDRERYVELHRRARAYFAVRLVEAMPEEQQRLLYDCIFLHRDNAVVRAAFTWQENPTAYPDAFADKDRAAVEEMVRRQEGEASAALVRWWLARQSERVVVFRDHSTPDRSPVGFFMLLSLHETTPEDRAPDPGVWAAWNYLSQNAPLRRSEDATHLRFWMARDSYQSPSVVQSLIAVHSLRRFLTGPPVSFTFFACADPDQWEPVFAHIGIPRLTDAEYEVEERPFGVFGHDWRTTPTAVWLERLYEREVAADNTLLPEGTRPETPLVVLSEADFAAAIRSALKNLHEDSILRKNPLVRSRIVDGRAGTKAELSVRVEALRELLQEHTECLKEAPPRVARGYRALHRTYLEPARTQEEAADALGLPFNTYRRHLAEGIAALTSSLWADELGIVSPVRRVP